MRQGASYPYNQAKPSILQICEDLNMRRAQDLNMRGPEYEKATITKAVATPRMINYWNTQCDSPTPSFERKDFVANTPHRAWACKAVHKSFKTRQ